MSEQEPTQQPSSQPEVASSTAEMVVTAAGLTDVGCQRSVNQDSLGNLVHEPAYAARTADLGLLYAVADGMGGHARGEVASALAIEHLYANYYAASPREDPQLVLHQALIDTNAAVHEAGQAGEGGGNMGTTLTTALLRNGLLYIGNVGDSRTYRIRDGKIEQLTRDHSLIGEQLRSGLLTEAEARASNIRNVITRAVGYREVVEPDTFTFSVVPGDIILLCSDGLHGLVEDHELASIISARPLGDAVQLLIDLVRERGGPDNITALLIRVESTSAVTDQATTQQVVAGDVFQTTQPFDAVSVAETARPEDDIVTEPLTPPGVTDEVLLGTPEATQEETPDTASGPLAAPPPGAAHSAPPPPTAPAIASPRATVPTVARAEPVPPAPVVAPGKRAGLPAWLIILLPLLLLALLGAGLVLSRRPSTGQSVPITAPAPRPTSTPGPSPTTQAVAPGPAPLATVSTPPSFVQPAGSTPAPGAGVGGSATISGRIRLALPAPPPNLEQGWRVVLSGPQTPGAPSSDLPRASSRTITRDSADGTSYRYELDLPPGLPDGQYQLELRSTVVESLRPCNAPQTMLLREGRATDTDLTITCMPELRQ